MKKSGKIILILFVLIVVFIIGIIIYKHETSDLVCFRHSPEYLDSDRKNYIIFSFDWLGRVYNGKLKTKLTYETLERAEQEFIDFQNIFGDSKGEKVKLDNKTVIIFGDEEISLDIEKKGRRKIKNKYEESGYECN